MPDTLKQVVDRVKVAKTEIANAITAKGGTVGVNDGLEEFASDIATIPSGGKGYIEYTTASIFNFANATYIKIPDGCKELVYGCFSGFTSLTEIELPATLISISSNAFYDCRSLLNIDLPNGLTEIGSNAFNGCSSLTEIEIPSTVENIYGGSFNNCTSLHTITINKPENSIKGKPWGATNATIVWTG